MPDIRIDRRNSPRQWRVAGWCLAAALLLAPLLAMQFTQEVRWSGRDFAMFGAMLLAAGFTLEIAVRLTRNGGLRLTVGILVVVAFLAIWADGAVGAFD